jgi:hypothetical protein
VTTDRDTRRVCDLTAADLFEAALAAMEWDRGRFVIELSGEDGTVRKVSRTMPAIGRHALLQRHEGEPR